MARMKAKYSGKCAAAGCGERFQAGAEIVYTQSAPKGRKTVHADCAGATAGDFYADSASAARGVGDFWSNNGRCEDAPCCGCCGIWGG
jgi:hypothetical protein